MEGAFLSGGGIPLFFSPFPLGREIHLLLSSPSSDLCRRGGLRRGRE